jgi:hypothetical protein
MLISLLSQQEKLMSVILRRLPQLPTHAKACKFLILDAFGSDIATKVLKQKLQIKKIHDLQHPLALLSQPVRPLKKLKAEVSVGDKPHRWDSARKREFDRTS